MGQGNPGKAIDTSDPTIVTLVTAMNGSNNSGGLILDAKARRLTISRLVSATLSGDTVTRDSQLAVLLDPGGLAANDQSAFYANLRAGVQAASDLVAQGKDPSKNATLLKLASDAATEVANLTTRRLLLQTVLAKTLGTAVGAPVSNANAVAVDAAAALAALSQIQTSTKLDADPVLVALPTVVSNAAAIVADQVAAPAAPVVQDVAAPAGGAVVTAIGTPLGTQKLASG